MKTVMNSNFLMTELAKSAKSFFSKCDLDLTSIYEVIRQGSSEILTGLYAKFIWLDTMKISSKSNVRLWRYCKFSSGVFFTPLVLYYLFIYLFYLFIYS